jgi:magnesium-protoporphyrin IX monomethyl ester (oxidative) cyclase
MKILLVNPPMKKEEIYSAFGKAAPSFPPLGLCSLASLIRKKTKHEINIIDGVAERLSITEFEKKVKNYSPDIVGITASTVSFLRAVDVANSVKSIDGKIKTILGGPHISAIAKQTMTNYNCFDIGVVGEGENTTVDLINFFNKGGNLNKIDGIIYKNKKNIVTTKPREPIKNLDDLPFPARDLLKGFPDLYNPPHYEARHPAAHMISSRGCPFGCIFCTQSVFGRSWRGNSAKYMFSEIQDLIEKFNILDVLFQDDLFTFSHERVNEFCNSIIKNKIDLTWSCSSRVSLINKTILDKMYKAGCRIIYYGIESGDQNMLNFMRKGITIEQITKVVNETKASGMSAYGSFILGFPTETEKSLNKTIEFAKKLPLDGVSFHLAIPYPGTFFNKIAEQYGTVKYEWNEYRGHPDNVVFIPKGLSSKFLFFKQKKAYKEFYLRLPVIIKKLKEIDSFDKINLYINGLLSIIPS